MTTNSTVETQLPPFPMASQIILQRGEGDITLSLSLLADLAIDVIVSFAPILPFHLK